MGGPHGAATITCDLAGSILAGVVVEERALWLRNLLPPTGMGEKGGLRIACGSQQSPCCQTSISLIFSLVVVRWYFYEGAWPKEGIRAATARGGVGQPLAAFKVVMSHSTGLSVTW